MRAFQNRESLGLSPAIDESLDEVAVVVGIDGREHFPGLHRSADPALLRVQRVDRAAEHLRRLVGAALPPIEHPERVQRARLELASRNRAGSDSQNLVIGLPRFGVSAARAKNVGENLRSSARWSLSGSWLSRIASARRARRSASARSPRSRATAARLISVFATAASRALPGGSRYVHPERSPEEHSRRPRSCRAIGRPPRGCGSWRRRSEARAFPRSRALRDGSVRRRRDPCGSPRRCRASSGSIRRPRSREPGFFRMASARRCRSSAEARSPRLQATLPRR